ncbi:syntaxin-112 [Magnolia sinica]|uniref:syntaxin-112 n=1 Tax=Magnolia sinica TaxID=86752 RepID=UPI00265B37D6|nr:syntaxin-112 [Magnolia sinica]
MNDLMTKSFLNYVELKKQALRDLEAGPDTKPVGSDHEDEENLTQFFEEVGAIKAEMEVISNLLLDLQSLNKETKSSHSTKVFRGLKDRMDSDMVTILRKARIIKGRLEALDQSNITNRSVSTAYKEGSPVDRTRISVTNGLRSKLREMMNDFQSLREQIVSEHKEGLKRSHFNTSNLETNVENIEQMVSAGQQMQVLDRKDELELEIQEREEAVKQIQRSLMELNQVFLDMAILIEAQGEQMDDIELNVVLAGNYIGSGTEHLASAKEMRKIGRKRVGCIWALVLTLILMLGVISILIIGS